MQINSEHPAVCARLRIEFPKELHVMEFVEENAETVELLVFAYSWTARLKRDVGPHGRGGTWSSSLIGGMRQSSGQ